MKVAAAIRAEFDRQKVINDRVEIDASNLIRGQLPQTWHFEGRGKGLESFALKIETGRFVPTALEDFYACTLVVPTLGDLGAAETLIEQLFVVQSRRPENDSIATSRATEFTFDHIRLYVRLRVPTGLDEQELHRTTFEVQIKTFLQHAWSIATHDLTYKTDSPSWGKERIAAQAKATLEAVEVAIVEAALLVGSANVHLNKEDIATTELLEVMRVMRSNFGSDLPEDLRRLSQSVQSLFIACRIKTSTLTTILDEGKARRGGSHPANLSPFSTVVQYLFDTRTAQIQRALTATQGRRFIFISPDIDIPSSFDIATATRAVQIAPLHP